MGLVFDKIYRPEDGENFDADQCSGSQNKFLSLSIGQANTYDGEPMAIVSASGSMRVGKKVRLFAEYNHFQEGTHTDFFAAGNLGASWFDENNRIDLGFTILNSASDYVLPFPIAAYSHHF